MIKASDLRSYLEKEYGIHNTKELDEAMRQMKPLEIGIFISPLESENKKVEVTTYERCTATA